MQALVTCHVPNVKVEDLGFSLERGEEKKLPEAVARGSKKLKALESVGAVSIRWSKPYREQRAPGTRPGPGAVKTRPGPPPAPPTATDPTAAFEKRLSALEARLKGLTALRRELAETKAELAEVKTELAEVLKAASSKKPASTRKKTTRKVKKG